MFKKSLKRLVSATLIYTISIAQVSCGGTAATKHAAQQLAPTVLPSVQVRTRYPGAAVNTILDEVVPPLKDSIFQYAENIDHMSYTANSDGSLIMNVYLTAGTNPDEAAQHISNIVSVASPHLPSSVVQSGVTVVRQNNTLVMAVDLYSADTGLYDQAFLTNYANINIIPQIQRISGVSHLFTLNEHRDSGMRISLNKAQMAALNVTLNEVLAAIPAGKLASVTGILYKKSKPTFDYIVKCKSEQHQPAEYGNMMIRRAADTVLRLKEVAAKVECSPYVNGNFTHLNGKPGVSIVVMQSADSNYNEIQIGIKKVMEKAAMDFPTGIKHLMLFNPKDSLYISLD